MKCIEDEIPLDLPEGWAWERLSNLAAFSGGKTPSTSRREYWDGEVLWVTSKDMKSKYITSSQLRLSALGAEQMQVYQPDTLLLVTRSGILRHTLPIAILKECATVNQDLKAIVLYMPELAEYIYVCLKGMETQLLLKYTKSGTTVENVNFDEFRKVLLPIAPLHEVGKIIAATNDATQIVSAIEDDKVALAEYVARAKAKILDLAIRGQLVPQDPNDEPASVLLERIRAEKEELIRQGKIKRDKKESVIFRGEDNSYYEKIGGKVVNIDDEILRVEIPYGLAHSYGFVSPFISFSSDLDVACFYAVTEFVNGSFKIKKDGMGVIDVIQLSSPFSFNSGLSTLGKQLFVRPGINKEFLCLLENDCDLYELPHVDGFVFNQNESQSQQIFDQFHGGEDLMPQTVLQRS